MQIGFLIDSFAIGGTELNAIKVAECLSRHSVTLTVFHFQMDGPLRRRYEQLGVELIHVPLHGFFSASARRAIAQVSTASHERELQLLHAHCVYSNILGIGIRRFSPFHIPLLASRRWTGYAVRSGLHTLNRVAQSSADAVLVNSPSLVAVVRRESPWSRPVYVPNLLPEANFRVVRDDEKRERRLALGLPAAGPIVGCVARLVPVKDHRTLLQAWQLVVKDVPEACLAIIGDGSLRLELEALARSLAISSSVRFTGEVAPDALPHSLLDVSVLTSTDEGFPNSLLEAMAQGVPVVSTDVGGVSDLVTDGQNGLLVTKGDVLALSQTIVRMLNGALDVVPLVAEGRRTATTHRENMVLEALLATYQGIALR